jgi:hypothetical protein
MARAEIHRKSQREHRMARVEIHRKSQREHQMARAKIHRKSQREHRMDRAKILQRCQMARVVTDGRSRLVCHKPNSFGIIYGVEKISRVTP